MHGAAQSRCLQEELRVCNQKRNETLNDQPRATEFLQVNRSNAKETAPDQYRNSVIINALQNRKKNAMLDS